MKIPSLVYYLLTNRYFLSGLLIIICLIAFSVIGPYVYQRDPSDSSGPSEVPPGTNGYPLGTDYYGRDVLAQLIAAIRNSLYVGMITALTAIAIGLMLGLLAGLVGGKVDTLLTSITDMIMAIPHYLLALLIAAYSPVRTLEMVGFVIGITAWPWFARAVRAQAMSLKNREFVYFSRMAGTSTLRIAFEDILPGILTYVVVAGISFTITGIQSEAFLSMIGLGPSDVYTLGKILYWSLVMDTLRRGIWWWWGPPGFIIVILSTALYYINLGLEILSNPRVRGE
ncbi:MAG: ABC transporter permease [Staphylothermus sp.]|nr:ABC transporter permease [Staphylothermus sp.]